MTRVYLAVTPRGLRTAQERGWFGPGPLAAHAVTTALEAELPDAEEDEREYAALSAAAVDCLAALDADEPALRIVVAADVDDVTPRTGDDDAFSAVTVAGEVPRRRVAALLVDAPEAGEAVAAARTALLAREPAAEKGVEQVLEHELGWFAVQEIGDVLALLDQA